MKTEVSEFKKFLGDARNALFMMLSRTKRSQNASVQDSLLALDEKLDSLIAEFIGIAEQLEAAK